MIINTNNKDNNIFKGIVKRGFNQSPEELKEKRFNMIHNISKDESTKEANIRKPLTSKPNDLSNAFNNLRRLNK